MAIFNAWVMIICCVAALNFSLHAQTYSVHNYAEDVSNIPNPERGFYHHTETSSGSYSPLNENTLRSYREEGITLILRVFYLNDFVSKPIPEQYLLAMHQDFNTARRSGIKILVRFAYTKKSTAPYGDATPEWALRHIEQLGPVLKQHGDVIAAVQAGFIGAWGEWYYTDHFSATLGSPNATDWQNRRNLVNALLAATPSNRSVQVRTPAIKFSLLESITPLGQAEAFTETSRARLGHHNDCFLATANDMGTYTSNMAAEKAFLETETMYLPMGGETCGESVPLSECPNALEQMKRFHWSYLNKDYHQGVLGSWQDGDCMPEVFQKLGYRFRLVKSIMQENTKPGGVVNFSIKLLNEGWAAPYNKRLVQLVMKHVQTGKTFLLPLAEDPRRWSLSDTIQINVNAGISAQVATGDYKMFLNFPDPERTLSENPAYAIRLANVDVWNAETGMNDLQHTITVSKSSSVSNYNGEQFFMARSAVMPAVSVHADGAVAEWQMLPALTTNGADDFILKAYNTSDSIFFMIQANNPIESFEMKLDVDVTHALGELSPPWNLNHADYRVTSSGISFYQEDGSWTVAQPVVIKASGNAIEIGIQRNQLAKLPTTQLEIAVKVVTNSGTTYIPLADESFVSYRLLLPEALPLHATSSGNKVILYWANEYPEYYRTIERSIADDAFEKVSVRSGHDFVYVDQVSGIAGYRSYLSSADGLQVSAYSPVLTLETTARPAYYIFTADGDPMEWEDVQPLATTPLVSSTQAYRIFISAEKLSVLLEGRMPDQYSFYFDMDNSNATGSPDNPWAFPGFDFLLQNDSLFDLREGGKYFLQKAIRGTNTGFLEVSVPLTVLDNLLSNTTILTAAVATVSNNMHMFPSSEALPLKFSRILPAATPMGITVSNSETLPETQLIVQWQSCASCKGFIIERASETPIDFATIATKNASTFALYDNGLTTGNRYHYRVLAYNDAGVSAPSSTVSGIPGSVTATEKEDNRAIQIYPNPSNGLISIQSATPLSGVTLMDLKGQVLTRFQLFGASRQEINVSGLRSGIYFLRFDGKSSRVYRIVRE
jgi:hypothetical protein